MDDGYDGEPAKRVLHIKSGFSDNDEGQIQTKIEALFEIAANEKIKKIAQVAMEFIFVCPNRNRTFETADFTVVENRGVVTDAQGNKRLDAKVVLDAPCPLCGDKHVYPAWELSCPFTG